MSAHRAPENDTRGFLADLGMVALTIVAIGALCAGLGLVVLLGLAAAGLVALW